MWTMDVSDTFERRHKRAAKDTPRELSNALALLNTYFKALCEGAKPLNLRFSGLHDERRGLYATDQGKGKGLAQLRLYFYPDTDNRVLWLLTIGDKGSQSRDIQDCRDMVSSLSRQKDKKDDRTQTRAAEGEGKGPVQERGGDGA